MLSPSYETSRFACGAGDQIPARYQSQNARALGFDVSDKALATADEVIE
jgi:hypothetical protein